MDYSLKRVHVIIDSRIVRTIHIRIGLRPIQRLQIRDRHTIELCLDDINQLN